MKNLGYFLLKIILHLSALDSIGQVESINTDRPDQSDGVYIIPKNKLQFENGITQSKNSVINTLELRYGLTHSIEVGMVLNAGKVNESKGLQPLILSAKKRLIQQHKVIPAITLVGYVSIEQLASKDFRGDDIPLELILAFENEINDKFSISYNVGTTNEFDVLNYTLNCSYTPKEKITTFIEYFSTVTKVGTVHNADAGVMYLINPRWQIDIACGGFVKGSSTDFYTTFGFAHIF